MSKLNSGSLGLVVTTELAARGLDAPILSHVINLDLPTDSTVFFHFVCIFSSFCSFLMVSIDESEIGLSLQLTALLIPKSVPLLLCSALRAPGRKSRPRWASGHCRHLCHSADGVRGGEVCLGIKCAHSTRSHVCEPVAGSATSEQVAEA